MATIDPLSLPIDPELDVWGQTLKDKVDELASGHNTLEATFAGVVGGAPSVLDTLAEIDAQIAADEGSAAALAAVVAAQGLLAWTLAQAFTLTSATRDANEAITTASVIWPDGATGTFTTDTASTAFPGAIDAYHVTHVLGGVTKTVTQTAVTRDAGGAVVAQPSLTVA